MSLRKTLLSTLVAECVLFGTIASAQQLQRTELDSGWRINSSCKIKDSGDSISRARYQTTGWYKAAVPTTVLAAQVAAGEFPDPYFGMNLRNIPGTTYKIGNEFSREPMPADSPYACSWWYRTTFRTPEFPSVALHFDGINYRANIWLNGEKIADSKNVAGAYRNYAFDIGEKLAKNGENVLAVEVFAPSEKDLGINWVDWNPAPPDKDMGLWSKVYLTHSRGVEIRYPAVYTHFADESLASAELAVVAELHNASAKQIDGDFRVSIPELKLTVRKSVTLAPNETRNISLTPAEFPSLNVRNVEPWWPAQMGKPRLYAFGTEFLIGQQVSDRKQQQVGLREVTSELTKSGARLFRINGKPILIRGGGWAPDMLLRSSAKRLDAEFAYVEDMNLNTIRLEGKMESDEFFDRADRLGILVMAGWCCCDIWEKWDQWHDGQLEVGTASVRSQAMRLRARPSVFVWLNGSDGPPPAEVEQAYIQALKDAAWPNPYLSSASATPTTVTGASGVKMTGPYDYVTPAYWQIDKNKRGGAFGFNTETSPGSAIPVKSSLLKFVPASKVWPPNEVWNYHAGGEGFQDLHIFNDSMNAQYGAPKGLDDYEVKAQAMAYDGQRAMFEAYSRNKYTSTGLIQWMLNNAWPSLIWHLYDYYLQPAGGYFGTKKANEPVHVQYGYDDNSISVVNSTYAPVSGLTASVRVYDFNLKELFRRDELVSVDADAVTQVLTLPELPNNTVTYFVQLTLGRKGQKPVSENFYWLSTKQPEFAWDKTTYVSTPITAHPDFTMLSTLSPLKLEVRATMSNREVRVRIKNPTEKLAFQAVLAVKDKKGEEILPVLWQDNYISLLPGESREVVARFPEEALIFGTVLEVSGWNIVPQILRLSRVEQGQATERQH